MRRAFTALLVGLMAALPGSDARAGTPINANLDVGAGYVRSDSWSELGHLADPAWDLDLAASASGGPLNPGLLQWRADADYRPVRGLGPSTGRRVDNLGYRLSATALADKPVSATASAARTHTDFASSLAQRQPGTTLTQGEAGELSLRPGGDLPNARVALARSDTETRNVGLDPVLHGSTALRLGLGQAPEKLQYGLEYETTWNDGTYAESNYRFHGLNFHAQARPDDKVLGRISQHYYRRLPTLEAPTNPRLEDSRTGVGVQWRPDERRNSTADYTFSRALVQVPGADSREALNHGLRAASWYRWSKEINLEGNAALAWGLQRLGDRTDQATGQSIGAGLNWARERKNVQVLAGGGANVGLVEPSGGGIDTSWGLQGSAGANLDLQRLRAQASYTGSFSQGSVEARGWALTQQAQLAGDGVLRKDFAWRGRFDLNYARREDPLFGTGRSRGASLTLDGAWRAWLAQAGAGLSDGLSRELAPRDGAAGLLAPVELNTVSRYAHLSTTVLLDQRNLSLTGLVRTVGVTAPARPVQVENSASLLLGYRIGKITFALEERYSRTSVGEAWYSGNLVYARIVRSFGGSF